MDKNLHQLLVQYQVQIKIFDYWTPKPQRENDQIIMQYVVDTIPEWAWESINKCRLFLKANTISDLATIDGKYILDQIKLAKAPNRENKIQFPLQARPSKQVL